LARPTKQGIDYFPIDCNFDAKTQLYIMEKGANGFSVLVTIWQLIYQNEGYYIEDSKDLHLLIKQRIDVGINEVSDCINLSLQRNLFSEDLYKKYKILTSKAIQKRYFSIAKKKKTVNFNVNYVINGVDVGENAVDTAEKSTKVKVKVKVKEDTLTDLELLWNSSVDKNKSNLPKVIRSSDKRKRDQKVRLKDRSLDEWKKVFDKINTTPFLRGDTGDWKATFDWIMGNENNANKVMEDNYKDNEVGKAERRLVI
jgi:hypothetical protein